MSRIYAIAIGTRKGMPKTSVNEAYLREYHGVDGDCHAGPGTRQVSLLAREDVLAAAQSGITARPGDFAENITTEGLDFSRLSAGSRLRVGDALLEITEFGKSDWHEGDYSFQGMALVARSGMFARVLEGGHVRPSDAVAVV
jgi:MOSC domain-containing protein YiiM